MTDIGFKERSPANARYDMFAPAQGSFVLNLAVYYSSTGWQSLFKKCLGPLLRDMKADSPTNRFNLYFSGDQGDHIRLTMHLQGNLQQKVFRYKTSIQNFLDSHPSERVERPLPLTDSFFLDVPNNLVLINSFKPFASNLTQPPQPLGDMLKHSISDLVLETFSDIDPDKESLFNFYICLQITTLTVFGGLTRAREWLEKNHKIHSELLSSADLKKIEDQANRILEDNIDDFFQIVELVENGTLVPDTQWLARWYQACRQVAAAPSPEMLFIEMRILVSQHINFYDSKLDTLVLHILRFLLKEKK
jgi:hypothetical protein